MNIYFLGPDNLPVLALGFSEHRIGGEPVRCYECTVPVTLNGRLYLPLRDAWRRSSVALH